MPGQRIYSDQEHLAFNEWHRTHSLKRFLPFETARQAYLNDIDGIEYTYRPEPRPLLGYEIKCVPSTMSDEALFGYMNKILDDQMTEMKQKALTVPLYVVIVRKSDRINEFSNMRDMPDIESALVKLYGSDEPILHLTPRKLALWIAEKRRSYEMQGMQV